MAVGLDLCEVPRLRKVLARRPRLAQRVYTEAELAYAGRARDPTQRLAARFAAKEATMKALGVGVGGFAFREAEVVKARSGAPSMALHGRAAARAAAVGVGALVVTMTHTDQMAAAIVIALSAPLPPLGPRPPSLPLGPTPPPGFPEAQDFLPEGPA
ncbi:MAG TPA: holo-ACP synthase [Acidimicrobiales bacterium]|nr:holo-ACP synthase [Acidimicrobiales bacterium]